MTSDWAKNLVARKKQELEEKQFKDEKDLSNRRVLDKHSEVMWPEVVNAAEKAVRELDEEMGESRISFHVEPGHYTFSLRVGTQETDVRFDRQRFVISSPWNVYMLTVVEGNGVVWQSRSETRRQPVDYTSEEVAHQEVGKVFNQR